MDTLDFNTLQHLLWDFAGHRVLTVASRAGILGHLAESGAAEATDVAHDLDLEPAACSKMLGALSAMGVVEHRDESYALAPELRRFFLDGDDDLRPFILHSHQMYESWGEHLENWLRSGDWPHGTRTPEATEAFAGAMVAMGRQVALQTEPLLGLDSVKHMLDVGGGKGHWARVFCERHADLRVTVFDVAQNAEAGRCETAGTGLEDRIDFFGGDYLTDDVGGPYDLVLLANIVHQENRQRAPELIRRCAEAVAPGGRLAIVDFQIDEDRSAHLFGTLFAINMRDFGDTWTESTLRRWLADAGLTDLRRDDICEDRWIISGQRD